MPGFIQPPENYVWMLQAKPPEQDYAQGVLEFKRSFF
jgi:hypothetical protein